MRRSFENEELLESHFCDGRPETSGSTDCVDSATIIAFPFSIVAPENSDHDLNWMDLTRACLEKNLTDEFLEQKYQEPQNAIYLIASLIAHRLTAQILFPMSKKFEEDGQDFPEFGVWDDFAPRNPPNTKGINYENSAPLCDSLDRVEYENEYVELFCEFLEDLCHAVSESQSKNSGQK